MKNSNNYLSRKLTLVFMILMSAFTGTVAQSPQTQKDGWIAFYSDRSGNRDIYRMNTDGTGLIQLTTGNAHDECPAISPDGKEISFISERDGKREIYIMNSDGSNQTRVTNNSDTEEHPSWSPDGTKIYFMKDLSSRTEIWVINSDGTGPVRLTNNQTRDERPIVSPDGQTILFMSNRNGNYEIYMMNADGSNQRRITNSTGHKIFPAWSPDGLKITYGLTVMVGGVPQADIHVMNADGSGDIRLTTANGRDEDPVWSPDGHGIAFQSERNGNFEIYKMNSDGTEQTRLTNHSSWDGWPSWGTDPVQSGIDDQGLNQPRGFRLFQNYPNPFNLSTTIKFEILQSGIVSLRIVNFSGQEVDELVCENMPQGIHTVNWNCTGLPGGMYFYRMSTGGFSVTKKLTVLQ